tara:strand:- start:221 stop:475 length:255 start_codon:yes stop_codon:yes gene_type:complete
MEDMMGDIISTVKKSVAGLTGVAVCLLALGVVMGVLMGADKGAFYGDVVGNITNMIKSLGGMGLTGLITACIVLGLLKSAGDNS